MGKVKDTLKKIIKEEIKKSLNEEMTIYSKKDGIAKLNRMKKTGGAKIYKVTSGKTRLNYSGGRAYVTMYHLYTKNINHTSSSNPYGLDMMRNSNKAAYLIPIKESKLSENVYYDEDKLLKLVDKDKFLKYMIKSKYRNKPKAKDLKDMFDTYISGDKDMEKKYRKIRWKN